MKKDRQMNKQLATLAILIFTAFQMNAQTYLAKNVHVRIFSSSPIENIEAETTTASCAFNAKSAKMIFKVPIRAFRFEKALMQEHFNENYMESEKYPTAQFDGQILDIPNMYNNGTYNVKVRGNLTVHGVTIVRDINVKLVVKDGDVKGTAVFKVKCKDHKIVIPKVVVKNIAEEIEISVLAEFKMIKY